MPKRDYWVEIQDLRLNGAFRESCPGKEHLVRNKGFWVNQESECLAGKGLSGVSTNK